MSMMVVALLLRAWIIQMQRAAVEPRVLADDLLIMATGDNSLELFEYAYNATHKHLEDMGAKVAPKKCLTFSSNVANRRWLENNRWMRLRTTVKVVTDTRDLGAHLNAAAGRLRGATLTRRMRAAMISTTRMGRVNAPYDNIQPSYVHRCCQTGYTGASRVLPTTRCYERGGQKLRTPPHSSPKGDQ